ncbi:MAG: hypothetical protein IJ056_03580 [Acidaminococcaceae bacterium]|nr:hypothetical protein [Acidaminococcaceae bacterium]MBQ9635002.1 hypothetical protein [Acidaminococcaceae bacterium]
MIYETEFFDVIRNGDYSCIPNALYSLFILHNQDKEELIVHMYTHHD